MPSIVPRTTSPASLGCTALSLLLLGVLSQSCGSTAEGSSAGTSPDPGTEGAACRAGGSCDDGLACLSSLCVDPSSGAGAAPEQAGADAAADGASAGGASSGGGGGASSGSGGSDGSGAAAAIGDGGSAGGADAGSDAAVVCAGAHPNLDGQRRYCDPDACYCTDPFDTCFPASIATACCSVTPDCGGDAGPGGVDCTGAHPIIGSPRTCESGSCLCSDGSTVDKCFPQAVVVACCPPSVTLECVP